jgi:hypothetical protein
VNPRHLAGPSLFLFFVVVGTLCLSASPQTAQHFDARLFMRTRRILGSFSLVPNFQTDLPPEGSSV